MWDGCTKSEHFFFTFLLVLLPCIVCGAVTDVQDVKEEVALLDEDCKGDDLFIDGVYQKSCDSTFDLCRERCYAETRCRAFVFNYGANEGLEGVWTDGCCWLKGACSTRQRVKGKLAVLVPQHTADSPPDTPDRAVLMDTECTGDDLLIEDSLEMFCPASQKQCRVMCEETEGCVAYVYNYPPGEGPNPQATDTCCWLKRGCRSPAATLGKRTGLIRKHPEAAIPEPPVDLTGGFQISEVVFRSKGRVVDMANAVPKCSGSCDSPHGEGAEKATDSDPNTKWLSLKKAYLVLRFPQRLFVDQVALVTANDEPSRDPVLWMIEGSEDGRQWAVVHNATDEASSTFPPFSRHTQSDWIEMRSPGHYTWYRFSVVRVRGQPGTTPLHLDLAANRTLMDVDCIGDDLFFAGAYQRGCSVEEDLCRKVCSQIFQCGGYVYNYQAGGGDHPLWNDGCCWLKTHCSKVRRRQGKKAVILRHKMLHQAPDALDKRAAQLLKNTGGTIPEALDALLDFYEKSGVSSSEMLGMLKEWMRKPEEGDTEDHLERVAELLQTANFDFAVPQPKRVQRLWDVAEKDLQLAPPRQQESEEETCPT